MASTVFFSWQADTPTRDGRNLIERALDRAAARLGHDTTIEEVVRELTVDRDTKDVPGSPPIVETIFRKIDKAAVFVPDLTFVGKRLDGRPTPNPNVLIEYGWALRSLGHARIVPVMNTAFGHPSAEAMPFNLHHLRNPITYHCPAEADEETRKQTREKFAKELEHALRIVFASDEFKASIPKAPTPLAFVARRSEDGLGRFRPRGQALGVNERQAEVHLKTTPAVWLRVIPQADPGRTWLVADLRKSVTEAGSIILPLTNSWSSYSWLRDQDGFGVYAAVDKDREEAESAAFAFTTGEIWSIDTHLLTAMVHADQRFIPDVEEYLQNSLQSYSTFLTKIGVHAPHRWIAGMEDTRGRALYSHNWFRPRMLCMQEQITSTGTHSPDGMPRLSLRPFFTALFDACGAEWPG